MVTKIFEQYKPQVVVNLAAQADEYIEKYLAEKELNLNATLDAKEAYSDADFVVIVAPTNAYSTNHIDMVTSKRACFVHSTRRSFVA